MRAWEKVWARAQPGLMVLALLSFGLSACRGDPPPTREERRAEAIAEQQLWKRDRPPQPTYEEDQLIRGARAFAISAFQDPAETVRYVDGVHEGGVCVVTASGRRFIYRQRTAPIVDSEYGDMFDAVWPNWCGESFGSKH